MPEREVWYSVKYKAIGPVEGDLEAMARAVITYHQGVSECYASAPDRSHLKGHAYAVHLRPYNNSKAVYDILQEHADGTYTYVATAFVMERLRPAPPPEDYIKADVIFFDKRGTAESDLYQKSAA